MLLIQNYNNYNRYALFGERSSTDRLNKQSLQLGWEKSKRRFEAIKLHIIEPFCENSLPLYVDNNVVKLYTHILMWKRI